ncbi:MAG: hypothetical protein ACRECJ_05035, partial [Limisphaerales bacterium]
MKKLICFLFAFSAELVLAAGRLSTVSVSENGTVMLTTGNPNEFKSSWSGQPGQYKMIIELPGVTVDKTAKVLGNLAANRGIKNVRFSQFKTEPPVAQVIIETPERLSYSWSTKLDGVELHFMLPSPVTTTAKTAPATTGFAVPSSVFSQDGEADPSAATGKRLAPPPASTARQAAETAVVSKDVKADVKTSTATSQNTGTKTATTVAGSKPATVVSIPTPKSGSAPVSQGTNGSTTKTTDSAVKPGSGTVTARAAGTTGKQSVTTEMVKPTVTTPVSVAVGPPAPGKSVETVKAPVSGQQKDSAPTGAISTQQGKTGTTVPAKSTPSAGASLTPTSGGTGIVVKPSSPASGQPAPTVTALAPAGKPKTITAGPTVPVPTATPSVAKTVTGTAAAPAAPSATVKPAGPPPPPGTKPVGTTVAKPSPVAPPPAGITTDTADQEKFKEQLKKALGKLETPAQPTGTKPAETGPKTAAPAEKPGQTSFQEQLKQALDPAKSLTDTGEVADVDDIDTDLPATDDEEEEPYDTTFAFPGGTFMQVSPSRKVIRYHSEGRRDPFSPLTGRDRYASGKKRRAVPAAE